MCSVVLFGVAGGIPERYPPVVLSAEEPEGSGGGELIFKNDLPPLTERQRADIQARIDLNILTLQTQGRLPVHPAPGLIRMDWPLEAANGMTDPGYYGISAFVDHDPVIGQLKDYMCGTRSYDLTSGHNHTGTDFFPTPFLWNKMDNNHVAIIAAAPGTIVYKQDGNYDRNCAMSSTPWNAVYIQHADGSVAWYGHMKNGSVTTKAVGDSVNAGERLGFIGSSGGSTGPHLHFELHDPASQIIDPYSGPCNNIPSWWSAQRPYRDSAVNKLTTGIAAPVLPDCSPETSNASTTFAPGSKIYFSTYYRDQVTGQTSKYTIYRPDSSVYSTWNHNSPGTYSASYWYWWLTMAASEPLGVWRFEVFYNGQTYSVDFHVGSVVFVPLTRK